MRDVVSCRFKFDSLVPPIHSSRRPRRLFTNSTLSSSHTSSLFNPYATHFAFDFSRAPIIVVHTGENVSESTGLNKAKIPGKKRANTWWYARHTLGFEKFGESIKKNDNNARDFIIITSCFNYNIYRICVSTRVLQEPAPSTGHKTCCKIKIKIIKFLMSISVRFL